MEQHTLEFIFRATAELHTFNISEILFFYITVTHIVAMLTASLFSQWHDIYDETMQKKCLGDIQMV